MLFDTQIDGNAFHGYTPGKRSSLQCRSPNRPEKSFKHNAEWVERLIALSDSEISRLKHSFLVVWKTKQSTIPGCNKAPKLSLYITQRVNTIRISLPRNTRDLYDYEVKLNKLKIDTYI